MILITRDGLRSIQAEGIRSAWTVRGIQVGVVGEKCRSIAINSRSARLGIECWFSRGVKGARICSEIVIERDVLLENHHDVLDGSRCRGIALLSKRRLHRE